MVKSYACFAGRRWMEGEGWEVCYTKEEKLQRYKTSFQSHVWQETGGSVCLYPPALPPPGAETQALLLQSVLMFYHRGGRAGVGRGDMGTLAASVLGESTEGIATCAKIKQQITPKGAVQDGPAKAQGQPCCCQD